MGWMPVDRRTREAMDLPTFETTEADRKWKLANALPDKVQIGYYKKGGPVISPSSKFNYPSYDGDSSVLAKRRNER